MKKYTFLIAVFLLCKALQAQGPAFNYLPEDIVFNADIPTPAEFLGHEVGEWHASHDKLYYYMIELAKASDKALWEEYGRSYENRPLGHLIISAPQNMQNLETIRKKNLLLTDPVQSVDLDISNMPIIIRLGYGVHGNESSAQNASLIIAYYLVAGEGVKIDELLKNAVILIDPCLNPDGTQRHSTWVNSMRSMNDNPDPNSMEFNETWPGGRTNHYWFDLNRDWLLLQHPESVGRVDAFFKWRPAIVTDHHETRADRTFFFQPGIPGRDNPLVPEENQVLTAEFARYHAKYLDKVPALYLSEELYDDFYLGKGSSYPDIHGSIGILFEQAGVKGHLRETPSRILSFPAAIKNQVMVSLSTLEAGLEMRERLLDSQRRFYTEALEEAKKYLVKGFVFSEPFDNARTSRFIEILLRHRIKVYSLGKDITKNNIAFKAKDSYLVPLEQNEFRFIRSLFEPVKEFIDSTFYDVSTWVLPMSFNIQYAEILSDKEMNGLAGEEIEQAPEISGEIAGSDNKHIYLFDWNEYYTPKALYRVLNEGLVVKVSTKEFVVNEDTFRKKFSYGTILITAFDQPLHKDEISRLMSEIAEECGITIHSVRTALTPEGIDLGSPSFQVLEKPEILMLVGTGMSIPQTGEIWHMLDYKFNIPVTMIPADKIATINLNRYNVLIIAGIPNVSEAGMEKIKIWNREGGTIIAYGSGNSWLAKNKLADIDFVPQIQTDKSRGRYVDEPLDRIAQRIPGAIFETQMDLTHPLCYGYKRSILPVMKTDVTVARQNSGIYNNPIIYSGNPLLSGYCTKNNEDRIKGNAFVSVHGRNIISVYDHTNFRAVWYGTNKVFMNAVFFGQIL